MRGGHLEEPESEEEEAGTGVVEAEDEIEESGVLAETSEGLVRGWR